MNQSSGKPQTLKKKKTEVNRNMSSDETGTKMRQG